ncbi:hypothetical protein D3C79_891810 [compost metagenome]
MLHKLHPARTARGHQRQILSAAEPGEQLGTFLHYGQIRPEVSIEHFIEPQSAQRAYHLASGARADRHAEFFS